MQRPGDRPYPRPAPDPVTALWKEGLAERIDLGVLSEEEVSDVATRVLGAAIAGASVRRLWQASGGTPCTSASCCRRRRLGGPGR